MDSYLLKCEETGIEALLVTIPTASKLFSKITPHEGTDPELEATLVEDLKNFRFKQALYCSTTEPLLNKKDLDSDYIKSESSLEFGDQSIYLLNEEIVLDNLEKIILLDGHHRFAAINKHYINEENEVPIIFINFDDLSIGDHYFSERNPSSSRDSSWFIMNVHGGKSLSGDFTKKLEVGTGGPEDYDFVFYAYPRISQYYKDLDKDRRGLISRFAIRDQIIQDQFHGFEPSIPPDLAADAVDHGASRYLFDISFAAKAPTKKELLSGEVFPTKSTWITPKFNPDLYREYLN